MAFGFKLSLIDTVNMAYKNLRNEDMTKRMHVV